MKEYFSLGGECVTEKIIEKSRFITTSKRVVGEEQAKAFIAEISAKYADATHNCYAYICDSLGNFMRFSDDGEPQGTAGMPILEVIKNKNLVECAVVVTRYFGGIKLGAGGLLRAYSGCASENLQSAQKVLYTPCAENRYTVDYPLVDSILRFLNGTECNIISTDYENRVTFTVAVKSADLSKFESELQNALNGRLQIQRVGEYFFPFPIKN